MKKEDKAIIIAKIGEELANYSCVYLTQTSGLDAEKTSNLRRACFGADVKMLCVKNTLLRKAFEASDVDYSGLYDLLHGETTLLLSNVGNAPAKLIKKFRDKNDTPMLWLCSSRLLRTLSAHFSPVPISFTASLRLFPKKKHNPSLKIQKNIYENGRFESICRTAC